MSTRNLKGKNKPGVKCYKCNEPVNTLGMCRTHYALDLAERKAARVVETPEPVVCICGFRVIDGKRYRANSPACKVCNLKEDPYHQRKGSQMHSNIW